MPDFDAVLGRSRAAYAAGRAAHPATVSADPAFRLGMRHAREYDTAPRGSKGARRTPEQRARMRAAQLRRRRRERAAKRGAM